MESQLIIFSRQAWNSCAFRKARTMNLCGDLVILPMDVWCTSHANWVTSRKSSCRNSGPATQDREKWASGNAVISESFGGMGWGEDASRPDGLNVISQHGRRRRKETERVLHAQLREAHNEPTMSHKKGESFSKSMVLDTATLFVCLQFCRKCMRTLRLLLYQHMIQTCSKPLLVRGPAASPA